MRKALIPMHPSLRLAGLLPPLDMPHHIRKTDESPFREGIVVDRPPGYQAHFGENLNSFVNIGLDGPVQVTQTLAVGQRVTVRMGDPGKWMQYWSEYRLKLLIASIVASSTPTREAGLNWGYTVRHASSISKVLLESPYEGGYDLSIGMSERGRDVAETATQISQFK